MVISTVDVVWYVIVQWEQPTFTCLDLGEQIRFRHFFVFFSTPGHVLLDQVFSFGLNLNALKNRGGHSVIWFSVDTRGGGYIVLCIYIYSAYIYSANINILCIYKVCGVYLD